MGAERGSYGNLRVDCVRVRIMRKAIFSKLVGEMRPLFCGILHAARPIS